MIMVFDVPRFQLREHHCHLSYDLPRGHVLYLVSGHIHRNQIIPIPVDRDFVRLCLLLLLLWWWWWWGWGVPDLVSLGILPDDCVAEDDESAVGASGSLTGFSSILLNFS